jgi:hypothetical protein
MLRKIIYGSLNDAFNRLYREYFYLVDELTVLCFTATGAPPTARHMQILPMNQLITFGMKGSNYLVDRFMTLRFTAGSAVHA